MKIDLEKIDELQNILTTQETSGRQNISGIAEVLTESAELITLIPDMVEVGASVTESASEGLSVIGELVAGICSLFS